MQVRPEDVGLSTERLNRIEKHLRTQYIDKEKVAGTLTLVARHGKVAYCSALGSMDLERGKPVAEDTIFRIYSMSKPITSVALMMLYEEGKFQLGDPVQKFIREWKDLGVYKGGEYPDFETTSPERPMTVRDLLGHQSGLTYGFSSQTEVDTAYRKAGIGRAAGKTLRDMVNGLASIPLEFAPGTRWNYSVSTDVVGYLVEVISGRRFDNYLKERIFQPLGMTDTAFEVPPEKIDRFAANYGRGADKKLRLVDDPAKSEYAGDVTFHSGGGGLVSTVMDYWRFCQMLLNGGELEGTRLLGRKTIELMTRNHLPGGKDLSELALGGFSETTNDGIGFGLGFATVLDTAKNQAVGSAGEYYWGGAASTIFWVDPAEDLVVVFMVQLMPSGTFNFRGQLKSMIYPAIID
jgi:CubicO group peptidase (beta-lactamase class C family)